MGAIAEEIFQAFAAGAILTMLAGTMPIVPGNLARRDKPLPKP